MNVLGKIKILQSNMHYSIVIYRPLKLPKYNLRNRMEVLQTKYSTFDYVQSTF